MAPNYVDSVDLGRWRSFPVSVFVDARQADRNYRDFYRDAGLHAAFAWSRRAQELGITTGIGHLVEAGNADSADILIRFDPNGNTGEGFTNHQSSGGFLVGAVVHLQGVRWEDLENRYERGIITGGELTDFFIGTVAHEMGHALGIVGHPPGSNDLIADINTLQHGYCR